MGLKNFRNNFLILLAFFLIGLIVHIKSFQLVPYGDDWNFIFYYFAHDIRSLHINNLPGIFAYLTPYGPSILTIGISYLIFEKNYFIYYFIPIIFKALAAFFLFLTLRDIAGFHKKSRTSLYILASVLFMVSMTGIQAIDWAMNTYVYIALSFFSLSLFFLNKFYTGLKLKYLILNFFLAVFSIIFASTRLTPFVLIFPAIDLILVISKKNISFTKMVLMKNMLFVLLAYILFQIGVFGAPGTLNNTSRIQEFINGSTADLQLSLAIFMHWVGITILPILPTSSINLTSIMGVLFLGLIIKAYLNSKNEWLIIGSLIFFVILGIMWIITPLKIADSADRFLVVPFFILCFLIGLLFIFLEKFRKILLVGILILFLTQIYSVNYIYSQWLSIGRSKDFIVPVEEKIMSHFPTPITETKMIFLDFDDGAIQQSVVFGLGFRVAFLSGTRNPKFVPNSYSNKESLINAVKEEIKKGKSREQVVENILAFQYRSKEFRDITTEFQDQIMKEI